MELNNGVKTFHAKTRKSWRSWLAKNHKKEQRLWLIIYRKESKTASVYYNEAVEEALCYGWVDSTANKRDDESFYLYFAQRKPKSNWSNINRKRAEAMMAKGQMTPAGQEMIDIAKSNGCWIALEDVQQSIIPADLQKLLDKSKKALANFNAFPPSSKRIILEWILNAKRPETRLKRLEETVELAAKNIRAHHARQ